MPFKEHPDFAAPPSRESKIWRYMDLTKLLSLIHQQSLWFSRLDKLSSFDPFEGYYTNVNLTFEKLRFEDMTNEWKESSGIRDEQTFTTIIESNRRIRELVKHHRSLTFVNSWHAKDHESAAMWKVYLNGNEGIAIQSTYGRLIDALDRYTEFEVHIGLVNYIDYEREIIPMGNALTPFMYKRKSFAYEDELRALIWTPQHGRNDILDPAKNKFANMSGLPVTIGLERLIERIYVAPNAADWVVETIRAMVERFGLAKEVRQSDLSAVPIY